MPGLFFYNIVIPLCKRPFRTGNKNGEMPKNPFVKKRFALLKTCLPAVFANTRFFFFGLKALQSARLYSLLAARKRFNLRSAVCPCPSRAVSEILQPRARRIRPTATNPLKYRQKPFCTDKKHNIKAVFKVKAVLKLPQNNVQRHHHTKTEGKKHRTDALFALCDLGNELLNHNIHHCAGGKA